MMEDNQKSQSSNSTAQKEQNKYTKIFNPYHYLGDFAGSQQYDSSQWSKCFYKWVPEAFDIIPQSQWCLQLGCGPTIQLCGFASKKTSNIILSQFNTDCFQIIKKQLALQSDQKSFWYKSWKKIAQQQNKTPDLIFQRVKQSIFSCIKCDLSQKKIFDVSYLQQIDVIMSSLCLEAVADTLDDYKQILSKINKLLKKDGYLFLFGVLQQTFYKVKDQVLPCFPLNNLQLAQFEVIKYNQQIFDNKQMNIEDLHGFFSVLAKKI